MAKKTLFQGDMAKHGFSKFVIDTDEEQQNKKTLGMAGQNFTVPAIPIPTTQAALQTALSMQQQRKTNLQPLISNQQHQAQVDESFRVAQSPGMVDKIENSQTWRTIIGDPEEGFGLSDMLNAVIMANPAGGVVEAGAKAIVAPAINAVGKSLKPAAELFSKLPEPVQKAVKIGTAATGYEAVKGATDPDYVNPISGKQTLPSQVGASARVGTGDVLQNFGQIAEWKGNEELGDNLINAGKAVTEGYEVNRVPFTWKSLLDPDWYANNVASSLPSTVTLIPLAYAGYKGAGKAAGKLGAGPMLKTIIASLGGATLSRPLESAMEAGNTYDEVMAKTGDENQANVAADRVFNDNLKLAGLDAAQLAAAFMPTPIKAAGRVAKGAMIAGKLGTEAGTEALEEGYQQAVQQRASGADNRNIVQQMLHPDTAMKESMAIGGLLGAGLGGAGSINEILSSSSANQQNTSPYSIDYMGQELADLPTRIMEHVAANLPPEMKTQVGQDIENSVSQGMDLDTATLKAYDNLSETEEGKQIIANSSQVVAQDKMKLFFGGNLNQLMEAYGQKKQNRINAASQIQPQAEQGIENQEIQPSNEGNITPENLTALQSELEAVNQQENVAPEPQMILPQDIVPEQNIVPVQEVNLEPSQSTVLPEQLNPESEVVSQEELKEEPEAKPAASINVGDTVYSKRTGKPMEVLAVNEKSGRLQVKNSSGNAVFVNMFEVRKGEKTEQVKPGDSDKSSAIEKYAQNMIKSIEKRNGDKAFASPEDKVKDTETFRNLGKGLVDAIERKDFEYLRSRMNGINPHSNRLFTEITGLPAKTQKEADASIRSLDPEGYDKWQEDIKQKQQEKDAERKAKAEREKADKQAEENAKIANSIVVIDGIRDTLDNTFRRLFKEGYRIEKTNEYGGIAWVNSSLGKEIPLKNSTKEMRKYLRKLNDELMDQHIKDETAKEQAEYDALPDNEKMSEDELNAFFGKQETADTSKNSENGVELEQAKPAKEGEQNGGNESSDTGEGQGNKPDSLRNGNPSGGELSANVQPTAERGETAPVPEGEVGNVSGNVRKDHGRSEREEPDTGEQQLTGSIPAQPDKQSNSGGTITRIEVPESTESESISRGNAALNNFRITQEFVEELLAGGEKTKAQNNIAAIKLVKQLEAGGRLATPEEQRVLAKFVGWGGLKNVFERKYKGYDRESGKGIYEPKFENWANEYNEVMKLLTEDEYNAASRSTQYAHYTAPMVVQQMYNALSRMGFKQGTILEPSMGSGIFFGTIPENVRATKMVGVEIDPITGLIAKHLYQKADVRIMGFQDTSLPNDYFDVAISNVPFGDISVTDNAYKENFKTARLHNYFFVKALDKIRPGGIIAFISSTGTLNAGDVTARQLRQYLDQNAEFLGAIRLPGNAFKKIANTEVTTDIIFLRKPLPFETLNHKIAWQNSKKTGMQGKYGADLYNNEYFVDHPEMMLGDLVEDKLYPGRIGLAPRYGQNLESDLQEAITQLPENVFNASKPVKEPPKRENLENTTKEKQGSLVVEKGKVYQVTGKELVPISGIKTEKVQAFVDLKNALFAVIDAQRNNQSDKIIKDRQRILTQYYDEFVKDYRRLSEKETKSKFITDPAFTLLNTLEVKQPDGTYKKSDIFSKRTIENVKSIDKADNAIDGLTISLNQKGSVDLDYISELTGMAHDGIVNELKGKIFKNPQTGHYEERSEYLSGNVRAKLLNAKAAAEIDDSYQDNVAELEGVQPKDLNPGEIWIKLGAPWIPETDVKDFICDLLDVGRYDAKKLKVTYSPINGTWVVDSSKLTNERKSIKATKAYGFPGNGKNAFDLIEKSLNYQSKTISPSSLVDKDEVVTPAIRKRAQELTDAFQEKQRLIEEAFTKWIWRDSDRRERLTEKYNWEKNNTVEWEHDGSYLTFPGKSIDSFSFRKHQVNVISRIIRSGNTLVAHVVGAGKTGVMVGGTMELRRLGLAKKCAIVVQKSTIRQITESFYELYPNANVLAATDNDFSAANRKNFIARIATGDWDAVILSHEQFGMIEMSKQAQEQFLRQQMEELREAKEIAAAEAKAAGAKRTATTKDLEKAMQKLEERLKKLLAKTKKDDVADFEQLGIDQIFVDEAQAYKNLYLYTSLGRVPGVGNSDTGRSSDMLLKTQYLSKLNGGQRGVVFLTGTPVSNSMTELYTMQRYLQPELLKQMGLNSFDAWAKTFGEISSDVEYNLTGTGFRTKTRFRKFHNIPELIGMFRQVADIKMIEHLPEIQAVRPPHKTTSVAVEPSQQLKDYIDSLIERAEKLSTSKIDPREDNFLKVANDGRLAALDLRLVGIDYDDPHGKINVAVDNVFKTWKATKKEKTTQAIFSDVGVPNGKKKTSKSQDEKVVSKSDYLDNKDADTENLLDFLDDVNFDIYNDIKNKLIKKGVPEKEIAFIHDCKNDTQRELLFEKINAGEVRIVLGSTMKMGTGVNIQRLLGKVHHLDVPWLPASIEQRNGRAVRQGNLNDEVEIIHYITQNSFDAYNWQLVENKANFIAQILLGDKSIREMDDMGESASTASMMKAAASGNPLVGEKVKLDGEIKKLLSLRKHYESEKWTYQHQYEKALPNKIEQLKKKINETEKLLVSLPTLSGEDFKIKINQKVFDNKKDANTAIARIVSGVVEEHRKTKDTGYSAGATLLGYFGDLKLMARSYARTILTNDNGSVIRNLNYNINIEATLIKDENVHTSVEVNEEDFDSADYVTRLINSLKNVSNLRDAFKHELERTERDYKIAEEMVTQPWEHQDKLEKAQARSAEIGRLLNLETGENASPDEEGETKAVSPKFKAAKQQIAPPFFSQLQRVIEQKMPNKAVSNQVLAIIKGGQVKQEEIKWSGVEDWLKDQPGRVDKQAVLDYLRANDVQVQEITKGAKYGNYTLPGGKNYRELLFTLPEEKPLLNGYTVKQFLDGSERWGVFDSKDLVHSSGTTRNEAISDFERRKGTGYVSQHWKERNVLAHVRFNDRTGENGEKILHIEEVQSDWHQEGRRKGYRTGESTRKLEDLSENQLRDILVSNDPNGEYEDVSKPEAIDIINEWQKEDSTFDVSKFLQEKANTNGVPDAPFKTTWPEFVLKRMIRYAAENGYDRISWTTGEQQAERYDLSKQVDRIEYNSGSEILEAFQNRRMVIRQEGVSSEKLDDYIGKEAAKKLLDSKRWDNRNGGSTYILEGEELKVGGEGMKGFYDKMIPAFLSKYAKKWGARIGETRFDITDHSLDDDEFLTPFEQESASVPSLPITDAMRESVLYEGQPLFKAQGGKQNAVTTNEFWRESNLRTRSTKGTAGQRLTDEEQRQHLRILQNVHGGITKGFNPRSFRYNPEALEDPRFASALAQCEALGIKLIPFSYFNRKKASGIDGFITPQAMYINVDGTYSPDAVAWHETGHKMKNLSPGYADLESLVEDRILDMKELIKYYRKNYGNAYTPDDVLEEFISDMFAQAFSKEDAFFTPEDLHEHLNGFIEEVLEQVEQTVKAFNGEATEQGEGTAAKYAAEINQAISSANTSLNQIAATFKSNYFKPGMLNIDIGGGKYDKGTQYLKDTYGTENLVYDPYNRGAEYNLAVLKRLMLGERGDTATANNVLNVIAEPEVRLNVIKQVAKAIKPEGQAYFLIYEGSGSGKGQETIKGWQNNLKAAGYIKEIEQHFGNVGRKGNLIIASEPKNIEGPAIWLDNVKFKYSEPESVNIRPITKEQRRKLQERRAKLKLVGLENLQAEIDRDINAATPKKTPTVGMQVNMVDKSPTPAKNKPNGKQYAFDNEDAEERWQASKGIANVPTKEKLRNILETLKNKTTREFEHLPRTARWAEARYSLLQLQKQKGVAMDRTLRGQQWVVLDMDSSDYDLFSRKVILDDLYSDKDFYTDGGNQLPFGFESIDELEEALAKIDNFVEKNEVVRAAVAKRRRLWAEIKDEYLEAMDGIGYDATEKLSRDNYYHHQVLEYANTEHKFGTGQRLKSPTNRGFLKKREGSSLDYNTEYMQAEVVVMGTMLNDIEIARTIKKLDDNYNIAEQVKAEAKKQNQDNFNAIVEKENAQIQNRIQKAINEQDWTLLGKLGLTAEKVNSKKFDINKISGPTEATMKRFNQNMGMAFADLTKLAKNGDLWTGENSEWDDVVGNLSIGKQSEIGEEGNATVNDLYRYLSILAQRGEEGSREAAMILSNTSKKREFTKETLGKKYKTWEDVIPDGYTAWQPREGTAFYFTNSISEKLATQLFEKELESIGLTTDDITKVLARGQKYKQFVIPEELAETLDNIKSEYNDNAWMQALKYWKVYQLVSPVRVFKYNFRNLTGDADAAFAGNPKVFSKAPQAWQELYQVFAGDKTMTPEMKEWFKRGGMQTLLQAQENISINELKIFKNIVDAKSKGYKAKEIPLTAWKQYWKTARLGTDFREALLRYAAYLQYLEEMQGSRAGLPKEYGASIPEEIQALSDIRDRAFVLSNQLLGAYDQVSVAGQWIRQNIIPFWSWMEVNPKRYVQLFKNAAHGDNSAAAVGRAMGAKGAVASIRVGKFAIKAIGFSTLLFLYNMLFFRDEEEELPNDVRRYPHIILGRKDDGTVRYFNRLGAFNDFLEWFGVDESPYDVVDFLNGKRTLKEIATDNIKKPVNKITNGLTPYIKLPMEMLTGLKFYPNVFAPTHIRDRWEHLAREAGLAGTYKSVMDRPKRQGDEGLGVEKLLWYESDPREAAYYDIMDQKYRYLRRIGKSPGGYSEPTQKSNALYYYKMAVKYKDREAANRYLLEYAVNGGTEQGLKQSLSYLDPLRGLGGEKKSFIDSLADEDLAKLKMAQEFYEETMAEQQEQMADYQKSKQK